MSGIAKNYLEAIAKNDPAMAIHLEGFHSLSLPIYVKSEAWPNLEEASTWFIAVDSVREGRELKAWLQKSLFHRLVLVVSDLKELAHWLMSSAAADLILSLQVQLLVVNGLFEKIETQVRHYLWQSPGFKAAFFDPSHRFQEIERAMLAQAHQRLAVLGEITRYGYWNWPNILRRLMSVEKEKSYYREKAWKNVPVLICGGGPSVDHLADVLPKARDYFFMISAGTGINVLEGLGVQPHLAMTVDPFRAQFSRFCLIHHLEQAHAAGWRSNYRALSCLSGPRYLLPGSDAYPMTRLWEEALDQDGPILDEGHNVAGMAMAVSKALGARSMGLVGIDLALSEGKLYGAQMTSTEKRWQGYSQLEETPLISQSVTGEKVMTFPKWLTEAKWISQFAKTYEGDLYRVGYRGLNIEKVPSQDLSWSGLPMRDYDAWSWCEYVKTPKMADRLSLTGHALLTDFKEKLNQAKLILEEKIQSLSALLVEAQIDLQTGPSKAQMQEALPMFAQLELDEVLLDLEMMELYPALLEIWSQCHKRVFECGFEIWANGSMSWLDIWFVKARFEYLTKGLIILLQGCHEAENGYFHVSDEV